MLCSTILKTVQRTIQQQGDFQIDECLKRILHSTCQSRMHLEKATDSSEVYHKIISYYRCSFDSSTKNGLTTFL